MARMPAVRTRDHRSDAELIEACNSGDAIDATSAFGELYRRHKDFVVRVAYRSSDDHQIALDALQETFAWLLKQFPPSGAGITLTAKMTSYLYPIARNSALTLLRKKQRFTAGSDVDPDSLPSQEPQTDSDIDSLLAVLPAERREVVLLRFVDGMSMKEIGEALGIPAGTVKSRLHLAIKQLRNSPRTKNFFDS